jgi:hypothetical protein
MGNQKEIEFLSSGETFSSYNKRDYMMTNPRPFEFWYNQAVRAARKYRMHSLALGDTESYRKKASIDINIRGYEKRYDMTVQRMLEIDPDYKPVSIKEILDNV